VELPLPFITQIREFFPGEEVESFLQSFQQTSPVSIRLNPSKTELQPSLERVPWSTRGYYLDQRPYFPGDPFWHSGIYYVQEASSMIMGYVVQALRSKLGEAPIAALDLCAAPGGKSLDMISKLQAKDLLLSNEVIRSRVGILYENVTKWGYPNHLVSNLDPSDFYRSALHFDLILVDAPCSGEGLFRKDPDGLRQWSRTQVQHCAARQKRILHDIWPALKTDGYLIYATCTFNQEENEGVMEEAVKLGGEIQQLDFPESFEVRNHSGCYRMLPHLLKGEGLTFFIVKKKVSTGAPKKLKKIRSQFKQLKTSENYLSAEGVFLSDEASLYFQTHPKWIALFEHSIRLHLPGVLIGHFKKGKLIPSAELALSNLMNRKLWPQLQLDPQQALSFLKKVDFQLDQTLSKGFHLVSYQNASLGFINFIGTRFNNLFPKQWRLRNERLQKIEHII
jgi:16S rRNA C967 or C1407 C5-methylase (RsmB/RsmF family)/NOL1/NOP2/fmu family ribosome biogenesis protein